MSAHLRSSIHRALLFTAAAAPLAATAAEPQQTSFIEEIEIVVVTGSYIEGAAEDAALPIDVLSSEDLVKQGAPSTVDLIKSIPAMQGVVGESNQFLAGQTTGSANVNLRGLGGPRTLLLLNGRRVAPSPALAIGYDANLMPPPAAIGRIEVLKDGAAATYGSDAVAGVVNFITKRGYEGLALDASYNYIDGSDGDYQAGLTWGTKGETWDVLLAGGYRHRSELSTTDRDWAVQSLAANPQGGWSVFGSPGTYVIPGVAASATNPAGGQVRDPGCTALGGFPTNTAPQFNRCQFQYISFDNLVEREEHYQAYGEFNMQLGESTGFHFEALYAAHDVPEEKWSPSFGPTQGPTLSAGNITAPNFIIPVTNPGFQAIRATLLQTLTPEQAAGLATATQVVANGLAWRPFGAGGNPLTGGAKEDERLFNAYRVSTGFDGEFGGVNWDFGVTYMASERESNSPDIIVSRLQAALRGLGGPNCTGTTAGQNGCMWLNPFSSGFQTNPSTGAVNNVTFNAATVNNPALVDWLFEDTGAVDTSTTFVVDLVFNGQLPYGLGAGDIGWAAGAQYRDEGFERDVNQFSDVTQFPCVDSLSGNQNCNIQSGLFSFYGPLTPQDLSRDVIAGFGELNVPLLENLSAQVAVRYEDYGGQVGATTNPKLSMRWQALDWFALRGSVGTTFRGPLQSQLLSSAVTGLAFTTVAGGYKPYDQFGNPNLKPEEAFTFNVGMIVKAGGFKGTLDYWSYDFEDALETENGPEIVAAFFANNGCTNPAYASLLPRFTFTGGVCSAANLLRTRVNTINGPDQKLDGIDASMGYTFDDVLRGDITVGTDATYTLKYERDASIVEGVTITPTRDFAGTRGGSGIAAALAQLRGSVFVDYATESQGVRLTTRYIDGVTDVRTIIAPGSRGKEIGSFLTYDLVYRLALPAETDLSAAVFNVTDEDPPFARLDLSYEPFLANPIGRSYKLALTKRF